MKPLSVMLREGTMEAHRRAESSAFVRLFLQGRLPVRLYVEHLAMLKTVYSALEQSLDRHRSHPHVQSVYFPELMRVPALQSDLEYFREHRAQIPAPASRRYAEHIVSLDRSPGLLAAHAYVRYMGDLSGGQALKRAAAKAYSLDERGLEFYEFRAIEDIAGFKDRFRAGLDSIAYSDLEKAAVVAEAAAAFELNTDVFRDLEAAADAQPGGESQHNGVPT